MSSSYNWLFVKIWCILCFGLHHYRLKPPVTPAASRPYFMNHGWRLWAIECPTQPETTWVKAKNRILMRALWVVQAIIMVQNNVMDNAASQSHNGSNKWCTFSYIFSYSIEFFEGWPFETTGKDFRTFYACYEWRHLNLIISILEVLCEVFSLLLHIFYEFQASWVLRWVLSGVVLYSLINKGYFLWIWAYHVQQK